MGKGKGKGKNRQGKVNPGRSYKKRKYQICQHELRNSSKQKLLEKEKSLERLSRFKDNLFRRDGLLADPNKSTTAEA